MKSFKSLIVILFFFSAVAISNAQVKLGVIGGINLATVSFDEEPAGIDLQRNTSYGFGAVVEFGLGESGALLFEPMYLRKGVKAEVPGDLIDATIVKTSYLELPVSYKHTFGSGQIKPYLMAGPSFGYLLSAKQEVEGDNEDIKDEIKDFDFGLTFGGGMGLNVGTSTVFLQGRYALGLANINNDPDDPDLDSKHRGIHIMTGVTFPLGSK